jgi:protein phosphatase
VQPFAAATHPGLQRSANEDCFGAYEELGLWLVADGVGGHEHGDLAATIARNTVFQAVYRGRSLLDAILEAHDAVLGEIASREPDSRMGSTIVAMQLQDSQYTLAWIGDSRAYMWNGWQLKQLTRDHSYVRDLVDSGAIPLEMVATHPARHALTQSLGVSAEMQLRPGELHGEFSPGQQMLLCSDGLTDELSDQAIADLLREHETVEAQVDALLQAALAGGGRDNITLIIVGAPAAAR